MTSPMTSDSQLRGNPGNYRVTHEAAVTAAAMGRILKITGLGNPRLYGDVTQLSRETLWE